MAKLLLSFRNSIVGRITIIRRITGIFDRRDGLEKIITAHTHAARRARKRMRRCPVCNKDGNGDGNIIRFIGRSVWNALCPVCNGEMFVPVERHAFTANQRRIQQMRAPFGPGL